MDVLDVMGDFGRYQKEIFAVLLFRSLLCSFTYYTVHFSSSDVGHWCKPPEGFANLTQMDWKECCVPKDQKGYSRCQRYDGSHFDNLDNSTLVDCTEWDYDQDSHNSVKSEWDLVCNRKWLTSQLFAAFFFGNLVSYPIAGYVADRIGRRGVMLFGCAGLLLTNTALYFVTSFTWFFIIRTVTGLPYVFLQSVSITYFMEITGQKYRPTSAFITSGAWGLFSILFLGVSAITSGWRALALISSFPITLPYLIICWRFLPESPRWLIVSGQPEKAKEVLNLATRKNRIDILDMDSVMTSLQMKVQQGNERQQKAGIAYYLKDKRLIYITLSLVISNVLYGFTASGYYIVLRNLGGNFHVNFIITQSLMTVSAFISSYILSLTTRRCRVLIFSSSVSGILYLITTALGEEVSWLRVAAAVTARMLNSLLGQTMNVFLSEIFPTKVRARGYALCKTSGRVGILCGSYIDLLSQEHGRNAPYFLLGGLNLLIAFLFVFVPDVTNQNLPDSVTETERTLGISIRQDVTNADEESRNRLMTTF